MNNIFEEKFYDCFLLPFRVGDITQYKIGTPLFDELSVSVTNLTVSDLLKRFLSGKSKAVDKNLEKQIFLVWFSGTEEDSFTTNALWQFVHVKGFIVPTFAFNYVDTSSYMSSIGRYKRTYFCFGYVLDKPIEDEQLMNNIKKFLCENAFFIQKYDFNIQVTNLDNSNLKPFHLHDITETYISNYIYVSVDRRNK